MQMLILAQTWNCPLRIIQIHQSLIHDPFTQLQIMQNDYEEVGKTLIEPPTDSSLKQPQNMKTQSPLIEHSEAKSQPISRPMRQHKTPSYLQYYAVVATKKYTPSEPNNLKKP